MTYGEMITRLEDIVNKLEQGDVELEDSLNLFDEASTLINKCNQILKNARLKVTELSNVVQGEENE